MSEHERILAEHAAALREHALALKTHGAPVRLSVIGFGLALGIAWGTGTFLLGLIAGVFDWGTPIVNVLGTLYIGYDATFLGSIAGAVWGAVDGFVFGAAIAWLYNRLAGHRK